jgi:hypothetical protein
MIGYSVWRRADRRNRGKAKRQDRPTGSQGNRRWGSGGQGTRLCGYEQILKKQTQFTEAEVSLSGFQRRAYENTQPRTAAKSKPN